MANVGEYLQEYRFAKPRRWRFDFAWPELLFAVEVDGLVANGLGGHQTIKGVNNDCEKVAEAILLGWTVLKVTAKMIDNGKALQYIEEILNKRSI